MPGLALSYATMAMALGGPLVAASLAVPRVLPNRPAPVRLAAVGVVAFGLLVAVFLCTTFAGLQGPVWGAAAGLALAVLALPARRRGPTQHSRRALSELVAGVLRPVPLAVFGPPLVAVLMAASRALLMPPLGWDSLTYHLFVAAHWAQGNGLSGLPTADAIAGYAQYPFYGLIMPYRLLQAFDSDLAVNLANFPFLLLTAVCVYGIGRQLGTTRQNGALAAALVVCSPVFLAYATTAYVDMPVAALLVAGLLLHLDHMRQSGRGPLLLAAAALGLALGTKPTALGWVSAVLLVRTVIVWSGQRGGHARRPLGTALALAPECAVIIVCGALPYLRSWWETGSPLYPNGLALAGHPVLPPSAYQVFLEQANPHQTQLSGPVDPKQFLTFLCLFVYSPAGTAPTPGWVFLPLSVLSLVWLARKQPAVPAAGRTLLACFAWLPLCLFFLESGPGNVLTRAHWAASSTRFLGPTLVVWAVVGTAALQGARTSARPESAAHVLASRTAGWLRRQGLAYDPALLLVPTGLLPHLRVANRTFLSAGAGATFGSCG